MQPENEIDAIAAHIARVAPSSAAKADELRERVTAILRDPENVKMHLHFLAEGFAAAVSIGTEVSDVPAAYQATILTLLDVVATLGLALRRLDGRAKEDTQASLALSIYARTKQLAESDERDAYINHVINDLHPHDFAQSECA